MKRSQLIKRVLSMMLALAMVLGMMPMFANAADGNAASVTVGGSTKEYATLQEAVAAASASGGTVKLLADSSESATVNSGKVTLDLNGFVHNASPALTVNGGEVTVTDSVGTGQMLLNGFLSNLINMYGGTLNIDGVNIYTSGTLCRAINLSFGTVNVKKGVIDGGVGIQMSGGTVNVTGGEIISGDNAIYMTDGTVNISGGWLHGDMGNGNAIYMSGGDVTVTGGTLGMDNECGYVIDHSGGSVKIQGGTIRINSSYDGFSKYNDNGTIEISGGTFPTGIWYYASYQVTAQPDLLSLLADGSAYYNDAAQVIALGSGDKKIKEYTVVSSGTPEARKYSVSMNLTCMSATNTDVELEAGSTYTTTLTTLDGYTLPETVTVEMGGKKLTTSQYTYANGVITIPDVGGDIKITAVATLQETYLAKGTLCGESDVMTKNGDVYIYTYTNVAPQSECEAYILTRTVNGETAGNAVKFDVKTACDVTVTYDPATGAVTVTGDGVEQEVITHRVVYYDNTATAWSKVNIYAWNDDGAIAGQWPGTAMNLVDGQTNIYYYVLPIEAVNVIFNDGSSQTADLVLPEYASGQNMYDSTTSEWIVFNNDKPVCTHSKHNTDGNCVDCGVYVGHKFVDDKCSCGLTQSPDAGEGDRVVYFQNTEGWSQPYVYTWTGSTPYTGSWPGSAMKPVEGVDGLYYYIIPAEAENIIFNNNSGTQTSDLPLPTDDKNMYTYSTNTWSVYTCEHVMHNQDGRCTVCGESVNHNFVGGYCTVCGLACSHVWKDGVCGNCGVSCTHSWTDGVCDTCGKVCAHSYADGVCSICGKADPAANIEITLKYPAVSFEDEIIMNVFFAVENLDDANADKMGLITFTSEVTNGTVENADAVIPGTTLDTATGFYCGKTKGIAAKNLGDKVYFRAYVQLADGSYVYSNMASYSPMKYAYSVLNGNYGDDMKALVAAMLNYGAAAQVYFNHNTDALVNADMTDAHKALVKAYSSDMIAPVVKADSAKAANFVNNGGFSRRYPSISFESAFCINYFFTPAYAVDGNVVLYYWTAADYNSAEVLTAENATGALLMFGDGELQADVTGIAAKELDSTIYVAAVYTSNGTTYGSGVLAYSIGAYCLDRITNGSATMQSFATATAVYGYYAKEYFSK